ncbi:hypothetical protein [Methanospirillum sp.]|uniref:hypothetical protein n=1 Tax=Methanospirillum sp. TaxID=45200 RepID=UPI0026374496|nr:hypothetical protein [Methanospirillum sp.]
MSTLSDTSSLIPPPIRDTVIHTLLPHGVSQILVFGSYAPGTLPRRVISISSFRFIPEKTSLTWEE